MTAFLEQLIIRPYIPTDENAVWMILEPVIASGDTYALPTIWNRQETMAFWCMAGHEVFVATQGNSILGTYYLQSNQKGGGSHVANCGYVTDSNSVGRGVARTMCSHSLKYAKDRGFKAMQYNFVVSTNVRAISLWKTFGFEIVGTLPAAFNHPKEGYVNAFVMFKTL